MPLLDAHDATRVLEGLPNEVVANLLEDVPADDATRLVELLGDERVDAVVEAMEDAESAQVRERLEFPEDSAGRLMSDEYLSLRPGETARTAIERLRGS